MDDEALVLTLGCDGLSGNFAETYCEQILRKHDGISGETQLEVSLAQSNILWPTFLTMENMEDRLLPMTYFLRIDPKTIREKLGEMEKTNPTKTFKILDKLFVPKNLDYLEKFVVPIPLSIGARVESESYRKHFRKIYDKFTGFRDYFKQILLEHKLKEDDTFLRYWARKQRKHIDFPHLASHRVEDHRPIRRAVSRLVSSETTPADIERFNKDVWVLNYKNELELFRTLDKKIYKHILFGETRTDYILHHSCGVPKIVEKVYTEVDKMVERLDDYGGIVWIVSDHGMEQVVEEINGKMIASRCGDHLHLKSGFYSVNRSLNEIKQRYDHVLGIYGETQFTRGVIGPLERLEQGRPNLTDMGYLISLYGNKLS